MALEPDSPEDIIHSTNGEERLPCSGPGLGAGDTVVVNKGPRKEVSEPHGCGRERLQVCRGSPRGREGRSTQACSLEVREGPRPWSALWPNSGETRAAGGQSSDSPGLGRCRLWAAGAAMVRPPHRGGWCSGGQHGIRLGASFGLKWMLFCALDMKYEEKTGERGAHGWCPEG